MPLIDLVKYNGGPDVFAWKFPDENLSTWTQLIVNESQEAVFLKDGKICDVLGSGKYTLDTKNIPILSNLIGLPFGGKTPFAAEIWFINKAHSLDIKWGTTSPIQLQDPKYNILINLRARGQFGIVISDSKQFLTKLVGTLPIFNKESLTKFFRGVYVSEIKNIISQYVVKKKISFLEINAHIDDIALATKEQISSQFSEYGINLLNFYIHDLSIPDNDPQLIKLKNALAKKAEMDIVGYDYREERTFDTLEGAAKNEGSVQSGLMGAGIGLGMGAGIGYPLGNTVNSFTNVLSATEKKKCPKCNSQVNNDSRFCSNCGYDFQSVTEEKKIVCKKCGAVLDSNMKFCPECGNPLIKKCPKCGAEADSSSKFCPECGTRLN